MDEAFLLGVVREAVLGELEQAGGLLPTTPVLKAAKSQTWPSIAHPFAPKQCFTVDVAPLVEPMEHVGAVAEGIAAELCEEDATKAGDAPRVTVATAEGPMVYIFTTAPKLQRRIAGAVDVVCGRLDGTRRATSSIPIRAVTVGKWWKAPHPEAAFSPGLCYSVDMRELLGGRGSTTTVQTMASNVAGRVEAEGVIVFSSEQYVQLRVLRKSRPSLKHQSSSTVDSIIRMADKDYQRWLRVAKALSILGDVLRDLAEVVMANFHAEVCDKVAAEPECKGGKPATRTPTCTPCAQLFAEVLRYHRRLKDSIQGPVEGTVSAGAGEAPEEEEETHVGWPGFSVRGWRKHPWELTKAFASSSGFVPPTAAEADVASLVNLLQFCTAFVEARFGPEGEAGSLPPISEVARGLCSEIRDIRNRTMHAPQQEVDELTFAARMKKFTELLTPKEGHADVLTSMPVGWALDKFETLRTHPIEDTLCEPHDEKRLLRSALEEISAAMETGDISAGFAKWLDIQTRANTAIVGGPSQDADAVAIQALLQRIVVAVDGAKQQQERPAAAKCKPTRTLPTTFTRGLHASNMDKILRGVLAQAQWSTDGSTGATAVGISTTTTSMAMRGMGGIGKTVTALEVWHDREVQEVFGPRMLWVTLGETPDVLKLQVDMLGDLELLAGCDAQAAPANAAEGVVALGEAFRRVSGPVLVVLDDVWAAKSGGDSPRLLMPHLHATVSEPPTNVTFLLTSRSKSLLEHMEAEIVPLSLPSEDAGLVLLLNAAKLASTPLPVEVRERLTELVHVCGCLPLALDMLGASVCQFNAGDLGRRGEALADMVNSPQLSVLSEVPVASDLVDRLGREPSAHVGIAQRVMESSLGQLPAGMRAQYRLLGVFPEDVAMPLAVMSLLWGVPLQEARTAMATFEDLHLAFASDEGKQSFVLHDLQREALQLRERGAAGTLEGQQRGLLSAFAEVLCGCPGVELGAVPWWRLFPTAVAEREAYLAHVDLFLARVRGEVVAGGPGAGCVGVVEWVAPGLGGASGFRITCNDDEVGPVEVGGDARSARVEGLSFDKAYVFTVTSMVAEELVGTTEAVSCMSPVVGWLEANVRGVPVEPVVRALQEFGFPAGASVEEFAEAWEEFAMEVEGLTGYHKMKLKKALGGVGAGETAGVPAAVAGVPPAAPTATRGGVVLDDGDKAVARGYAQSWLVWHLCEAGLGEVAVEGLCLNATWLVHRIRQSVGSVVGALSDLRLVLATGPSREKAEVLEWLQLSLTMCRVVLREHPDDAADAVWARMEPVARLGEVGDGSAGVLAEVVVGLDKQRCVRAGGAEGALVAAPLVKRPADTEVASGACLLTLAGHGNAVAAVGWCDVSDGEDTRRCFVSGSLDNTAKLWDAVSGMCVQTLSGHTDGIMDLCVASIGGAARILTASKDGTAKVWDAETGKCLDTLCGHTHWLRCITVAVVEVGGEARECALTASLDHTVRVWDLSVAGSPCVATLEGHTDWVNSVRVGELDVLGKGSVRVVVSGSDDHTVRLWTADGAEVHVLKHHTSWVRSVRVYELDMGDGGRRPYIVSASEDGTVAVVDPASLGVVARFEEHASGVIYVSLADLDDGSGGSRRCLLSTGYDFTVRVWDPARLEPLFKLVGHSGWTSAACLVSLPEAKGGGRQVILSSSYDKTLKVWDVARAPTAPEPRLYRGGLRSVCAGTGVAVASSDGSVRVWNVDTGERPPALLGHADAVAGVCALPDGGWATASLDGSVKAWRSDGTCTATLTGHNGKVWSVCVVEDEARRLVATGGNDGDVRVWDLDAGECCHVIRGNMGGEGGAPDGHTGSIRPVASATFDGKLCIVSGSCDNTCKVWEVATGTCLSTFSEHTRWVRALCVTPAGMVLSGSYDGTVGGWDPLSGVKYFVLDAHAVPGKDAWVYSICLVQVGGMQCFATASGDETVKVWGPVSTQAPHLQGVCRGHRHAVTAVDTVGDSRLVSASYDNTIKVWDADTQTCVATYCNSDEVADLLEGVEDTSAPLVLDAWGGSLEVCARTRVGTSEVTLVGDDNAEVGRGAVGVHGAGAVGHALTRSPREFVATTTQYAGLVFDCGHWRTYGADV